jgi:hypothetical protein
MGYSNTTAYRTAETDTFQLITHEVRPRGNALTCAQCHTANATQMNLKGMGYAMKGTQAATCTQCHGQENLPNYTSLHNKHVTDKRYDCSWCHSFSRPERGLRAAAGTDPTPPTVTAFAVPATAASLTVPISTLTATDNVAVSGYLVTETATKPAAGVAGWSSAKPADYTCASAGAKTLYGWAKDAAGNVSTSRSAGITITLSSGAPNISVPSSLNFEGVKVREQKVKELYVSNTGTTSLTVTKVEVAGPNASAFRPSVTSFSVSPSRSYKLSVTFRPTARVSYQVALRIYSNDPDTPIKEVVLSGSGTR